MKRSIIVNWLTDVFYECNLEPEDALKKAKAILDTLEEKGMRPPSYKKFHYSKTEAYNTPNHKFGLKNPEGFYIIKDEWEPEDEV